MNLSDLTYSEIKKINGSKPSERNDLLLSKGFHPFGTTVKPGKCIDCALAEKPKSPHGRHRCRRFDRSILVDWPACAVFKKD